MEKEEKKFDIPSAEDCLVNFVYWLDMCSLRVKEIMSQRFGEVSESLDGTESEV